MLQVGAGFPLEPPYDFSNTVMLQLYLTRSILMQKTEGLFWCSASKSLTSKWYDQAVTAFCYGQGRYSSISMLFAELTLVSPLLHCRQHDGQSQWPPQGWVGNSEPLQPAWWR